VLEKVMSDETVQPGEKVLTSGGDQIFPKGLSVGTVTKVSPGPELFLNIRLKPAADLDRLEEVLVITQNKETEPVVSDVEHVRAADILAQRLPSVPEKPVMIGPKQATTATMPGTPGTVVAGSKPTAGAATQAQTATSKPATFANANKPATVPPTAVPPTTKPTASTAPGPSAQKPVAGVKPAADTGNAQKPSPVSTQPEPTLPAASVPPAQNQPPPQDQPQ